MDCPNCIDHKLRPKLTKQGVEVDFCDSCEGIWLDIGEIFHFTKRPKELAKALDDAKRKIKPSMRISPKTGNPMKEISFLGGELVIDICLQTEGLWFDKGEIKKLLQTDSKNLLIQVDESDADKIHDIEKEKQEPKILQASLFALPNLMLRSTITIVSLYALLTFVLILAVKFAHIPVGAALFIGIFIAAIQFTLGPWMMDITLKWLYKLEWLKQEQLPEHLRKFVKRVCIKKGIKIPQFGLIDDGGPNAFTYGHNPNNARVVLTKGILNLLDEGEVEAVVAHEIGHAVNWDMLWMTTVQLVPLILYYIYELMIRFSSEIDDADDEGGGAACIGIAMGVYILYIVSQYFVLWFSRTREYYADRFSGQITGHPNNLTSSLVKIAYGLAGQDAKKEEEESEEKRSHGLGAIGAFGIFDIGAAKSFAMTTHKNINTNKNVTDISDKENALAAMKWDLWNPWAKYFEIHSTHPLVAKRIKYLGDLAAAMGQEPHIRFSLEKPESYWDEFFFDLGVMFMPLIGLSIFILISLHTGLNWVLGIGISVMGILYWIKVKFSYPSIVFPLINVAGLLKNVKVSGIRAIPCTLRGKLIGRGIPGLIWSEDFIFQDDTGIIFLDYRQPLRIWEFFFGLLRGQSLQNQEVEIEGWYRRAPVPYVEIKTLKTQGKTRECYVYSFKINISFVLFVGGLVAASVLY